MQTAQHATTATLPPAPAKNSGDRRERGGKGNNVRAGSTKPAAYMPTAFPLSQDQLIADAIDIFVTKRDGAIGEAAFRYDLDGRYDRATGTDEYYMREGDIGLHERYADAAANRINGVETAIIIGQGPGNIFKSKEGQILSKLPRLKRVITVDIADENNIEAARFIKGDLSAHFGRAIEHIGISSDFREAAALRPDLFKTQERRAVFCSGSTIMNLPPSVLDAFPAEALARDLEIFADMSGEGGHVLVTYDSNQNDSKIIAPYTTKEAQDLFMNVIDVQAAHNPFLSGLTREHFRYVVDFNREAHEVRQRLVVVKPYSFALPFSDKTNIQGVHAVNLHVGDEFHMISSYKPRIESVQDVVNSTGRLTTSIITRESHGPTIQLMRVNRLTAA